VEKTICEETKNTKPKVSIVMIAYNVERYLEQAIESVLMQKVNFSYELIIGEDCSSDKTREIALGYQKQYPEKIIVLTHENNLGLTPNCIATHNKCTGEYIALLDSDDYWTSSNKLQEQIDFLDKNPEFSACAHQSEIIFDDLPGESKLFGDTNDQTYTMRDMLQHRKFHTSSLVYRREYWIKSGGIPSNILSNERAIYPMLSCYGNIKYLKNSMCVYRRNSGSISSSITIDMLATDLNMIPWLKKNDDKFPYIQYKSFLHLTTFSYPPNVSFFPLVKHFLLFVLFSFSYFPKNLGDVKYGITEFSRQFYCNFIKK